MPRLLPHPLLRVPPFPGARVTAFDRRPAEAEAPGDAAVEVLLSEVKRLKAAGAYWGLQPNLPDEPYVLVTTTNVNSDEVSRQVTGAHAPFRWTGAGCDPWHLLSRASHVITDANDEIALIAAIAGVAVTCVGQGAFSALSAEQGHREESLRRLFLQAAGRDNYVDPFTGDPLTAQEAVRLCGFWRKLIDANREISAAVGFGFWKRATVAPLLWNGSKVDFTADAEAPRTNGAVAVWRSRTPATVLDRLIADKARLIEVEDGFIRSAGLGADCVPPLSIVVDPVGIYFDPSRPSLLEEHMQAGPFPPEVVQRARLLRELIVSSSVSKYGVGPGAVLSRRAERPHILVPGQVEDDRSVQCGGGEVQTNVELLRRVRRQEPDAYIIYKPHPDVEAGHRVGAISAKECLELADEIVTDQPITALIDLVDEVHVNTSLAGFEALLRGKQVTTHGVPFYAGWGLTRDLGKVPARRTAPRTLDELVAAALLLYPRYLDPVTGLPCPPEILVRRISEGTRRQGIVVRFRQLQGRVKRFAARTKRVY